MPIVRGWNLSLDVDAVLRAQGADPGIIRGRSPRLLWVAQRALRESRDILDPAVLYREIEVASWEGPRLHLREGGSLCGALLPHHLRGAERVYVVLCTIGPGLELRVSRAMAEDPSYALALDGVGSAAVEALANAACRYLTARAQRAGLRSTAPISPGLEGWPVRQGQVQVFGLLDGRAIGVHLTEDGVMVPLKSLSLVIGVGQQVSGGGSPCDHCRARARCRYSR